MFKQLAQPVPDKKKQCIHHYFSETFGERKTFMTRSNRKFRSFIFKTGLFTALAVVLHFATVRIDSPLPGGLSDKLWHGFTFFILAGLSDLAYPEGHFTTIKFIILSLYGFLIEVIQFFIPYRSFSMADMAADVTGLLIYGLILLFWAQCSDKIRKS